MRFSPLAGLCFVWYLIWSQKLSSNTVVSYIYQIVQTCYLIGLNCKFEGPGVRCAYYLWGLYSKLYLSHTQSCSYYMRIHADLHHTHTCSWQQSHGVCGNLRGQVQHCEECSVLSGPSPSLLKRLWSLRACSSLSPLLQSDPGWLCMACSFRPNSGESPNPQFSLPHEKDCWICDIFQ